MRKLFDLKVIFLATFLLLSIAIKNCENFQLRDFNDGVSESSSGRAVSGKQSTKVRYPFRKLEKAESSIQDKSDDDDDDDDDIDDDDDQNDSQEALISYKFAKVRKPTFEVKKRTNLRQSKLAQFREPADDDDDDDNSGEKVSFFSKILSFFKRKPKDSSNDDDDDNDENESKENDTESAEVDDDKSDDDRSDDDDDDEDGEEKKPLLTEVFDKFKDFLEARSRKSKANTDADASDEDDDDDNDENQKNGSGDGSGEDNDEDDGDDDKKVDHFESKPTESQIKISIKETFTNIFNRRPFNWIFDFDDSGHGEEVQVFEDSEEDELNYQRLLKEERDQAKEHTEQLIKQTSEEDVVKVEPPTGIEALKEPKKPATKKEKKTKQEAYLAKKEFEKLILSLPSFVPDYSKVKNPECQKQGEVFQRQLRGQRIWALEMMDANAKIPSGLMRGNTNQLGDFDLCTKISQKIKTSETNSMKMKGKYCLANIDVVAAADQLKLPVHLIQGRNFIRSTINDPNHFFPRYSTINWGLCLPSACTFRDADQILESFIGPYNSTGIKLHINVNADSCYVRQHVDVVNLIKSDWKIFGTCALLLIIIAATILATLNDYLDLSSILSPSTAPQDAASATDSHETVEATSQSPPEKVKDRLLNRLLSCFSAKRNISSLFGLSENENEIKCLHGLKALSIVLLFVSLKLISMGRVPYSNRNKLTEFFNSPLSVFLRSSFLYEDVFFVISGVLSSLSLLKDVSSSGKIHWLKKIVGRFLRLALPLSIVLLFYAFIWEHLGTGPQWSAVVEKNADLCKQSLWKNLLFVQNFYPFEDMCATHTYHLAIDLQLFILSPLLVWLIYKRPNYGLGLYGVLHALSAAARFASTAENRLSVVVFHGMKLSQLYRTFDLSLSVALHRATPYLVGIALGVAIKEFGKVQLPRGVVISGWISTFCGFIWCFYTPSNLSHKDYQYDPSAAAQYSALSPLLWSLAIAWIIFACYSESSWKLNCILSSRFMVFVSKISYSIYLIVFLVLFYFSGTVKSGEEFHLSSYIDRLEIFIVFTAATLFTLAVDLPMQNILKILLHSSSGPSSEDKGSEAAAEPEFESPFANDDEDFVYKPMKFKNDVDINSRINNGVNGQHVNGNSKKEETDEEDSEIEEEVPVMPKKTETNMNARRWKWEVLDD